MINNKIGLKLMMAVGSTALVTISVFAWFNIRSDSKSLLAEVERHANQLSEAVKSATEYDMLHNQRLRIHESITRMGNQKSIQRIRVLNKAGEVIYSSDAAEIGKMVDKKAESCYRCHSVGQPLERLEMKERTRVFHSSADSGRILGIITPIYNAPSCWTASCHAHSRSQTVLGVLDVTLPLAEVDKDIRSSQFRIAVFAISSILALSFIIGFFVKRWVDAPVKELLMATQRVAGGDLGCVIGESGKDELGMLARSFNNMTQKMSQARLQLFQSDKLASLGRLAAGVAHEINNPLTGVLTYSSFLLKRTKDQPELQKDLEVIVRETIRSREIVKSLLDFARQSVPNKNEADMNGIIDRAAAVVDNQLSINKIRLVKNLSRDVRTVNADANQMQQVFINLFVNAADAIGHGGGTIAVSSSLLDLPPAGITQIRKALCPKRHSLIDNDVRIDGKPSIRLKALAGGGGGFVHLDPVCGMNRDRWDAALRSDKGVRLVCPECSVSLLAANRACPECGAPVYVFEVPSKGMVEGCSSGRCKWRRWEEADSSGSSQFVELKVSDTGCGIAKEELPKIFEPFYSTKGQKGTGLGLAVIWGIVDNHNGTIDVESEVSVGTTFTIRIPVKP